LRRISRYSFHDTNLSTIAIPSSVCYVSVEVFPSNCRIAIVSDDLSSESGLALKVEKFINREAILRLLASYALDFGAFEQEHNREICERFGGLYRRKSDSLEIVTKEIANFEFDSSDHLFELLEMLTHLKHPFIAPLCGIVFPTDSANLMIAAPYYENGSLKDVLANPPSWWTPTAKSKAIVGIVLGMRFAHSLCCAHGSLKPSNILFDKDKCVQITDFCSTGLHEGVSNNFELNEPRVVWNGNEDLFWFSSILIEILVGRSLVVKISQFEEVEICFADDGERVAIPSFIPSFLGELIERNLWPQRQKSSFHEIYEVLKSNDFDIVEGTDVNEVLRFVSSSGAFEYEGE
jgi:serine/threonine protein kinase